MGTELLLGQIPNTNAQEISTALARAGVDVFHHSVVGDNLERIVEVLAAACGRAGCVIVTGGLGPTSDDLTRDAISKLTGRPLVRDERLAKLVRGVFERLGYPMPEANLRQADLPQGATPIEPEGTAPGFWLEHEGCLLVALPGVPWEMRSMMGKAVLPLLAQREQSAVIASREIVVMGMGESRTHELLHDIVDAQTDPTIAFLASAGIVRLRVTSKARTEEAALARIDPVEEQIRGRLGRNALPRGCRGPADALGALALERGLTVAAAESLTGGQIGAALTEGPGASRWFKGSLVCYTDDAKRDVAGVHRAILEGPGAVSAECAEALAQGARRALGADVGLSATGVAGPTEQDGKPVGLMFLGAVVGDRVEVRRIQGYGDREHVRRLAVNNAIDLARRLLL